MRIDRVTMRPTDSRERSIEPLSGPWRLRFEGHQDEIRLLVRLSSVALPSGQLDLHWRPAYGAAATSSIKIPGGLIPTSLGAQVFVARFVLVHSGAGGSYRLHCGRHWSYRMTVPPDPTGTEPWRFLIVSDYQNNPAADPMLRALARFQQRQSLHGVLFSGDLTQIPDELGSWVAHGPHPDPLSRPFFDAWGEPAAACFTDAVGEHPSEEDQDASQVTRDDKLSALLSGGSIFVAPGNHEVSSSAGRTPAERADNVSPTDWNLDTCQALFFPLQADHQASIPARDPLGPACYRVRCGPLDLISIFVARRWIRGNHQERTGPTYELPGRFIFQSVEAGGALHRWLQEQVTEPQERAAEGRERSGAGRPIRIVMCHHPPFAQGINSVPPFDRPLEYRSHALAEHLVPLFSGWADIVVSGHNHIVNHHYVKGVHYIEAGHLGAGKGAARYLSDGRPANEPMGHPSEFFASEENARFFAVLEVGALSETRKPRARVKVFRVELDGSCECAHEFTL